MEHHDKLKDTEVFKKIKKSFRGRGEKISTWITLSKEIQEIYIDKEENVQFNGKFLKEIQREEQTELTRILEKLIDKSEKKEEEVNLKHVVDKFVLEKFQSKKSNAKQWMEIFEKECARIKIRKDETKIELLRLFMDGACQDWYNSITIKGQQGKDWLSWKDIFIETFTNNGWDNRMYAYNYKYKDGWLVDYSIKKEKLLLEINKNIDGDIMIDLIALGLPQSIRKKIDREKLENTKDLINELRKHESEMGKRKYPESNDGKLGYHIKLKEKKPCSICEKLGKNNRYHPEEKCWFEKGQRDRPKTIGNNSVIEVDLNMEKNE
ncbi:uncharacterized protein LOC143219741 [Lasioglossum baleicum]|uniref:uncharacterized protein LOC143219741 n=1 Tax=Lasioglossum baleicum TaxID=434251 RepID=UPI003FCD09BC